MNLLRCYSKQTTNMRNQASNNPHRPIGYIVR